MRNFKSIAAALFFGIVTAGISSGSATAKDITSGCGALKQVKCTTSKATYKGKVIKAKPKGAFFDPRKGGEWWKCPSNYPRRTAYAVTDKRACATKSLWPNEKLTKAQYLGKRTNRKPAGAFVDSRLDKLTKGAEYWSCPKGYDRNANAVTDKAACTVRLKYVCDSSKYIPVGSVGKEVCYKRNDCGALNGRPCQIVERLPSCNKGLAEDFVAHECVTENVARCLFAVRAIRFFEGESDSKSKKSAAAENKSQSKKMPAFESKPSGASKLGSGNKAQINTSGEAFLKQHKQSALQLKTSVNLLSGKKKALNKAFTKDSFCSGTQAQRDRAFRKAIPKKLSIKLKKKAGLMDGLFIKSAHAAEKERFFMSYDIVHAAGAGIGYAVGLHYVEDENGNSGAYFSMGPEIVTNVGADVSFGVSFYPKVKTDSFEGWGTTVGISAGPPTKVVAGTVDIHFSDEKFTEVVGFGFLVAAGVGMSPVDVTVGWAHNWKLSVPGVK